MESGDRLPIHIYPHAQSNLDLFSGLCCSSLQEPGNKVNSNVFGYCKYKPVHTMFASRLPLPIAMLEPIAGSAGPLLRTLETYERSEEPEYSWENEDLEFRSVSHLLCCSHL